MKIKLLNFRGIVLPLLFLLFILPPLLLFAQEKKSTVTGVVYNAKKQPLADVSVVVRNIKTNFSAGTATDSLGHFTFNNLQVNGAYSFYFSAVGYQPQNLNGYALKTDASLSLVVELKEEALTLEEVVVVGYGVKKRSDVTSAIVSINAAEIRSRPVQNALQALQGKASGVDITTNERPGEMGDILIRGVRSLGATNTPLYVVDGIPLNFGGMNALNPNDIETIDILKDASATAIYGSRGANGVVLVTTKKGKSGVITLDYLGTLTVEEIYDRAKLMNSAEYIEFRRNAYRRTGSYPDAPDITRDKEIFGQNYYAWANVEKGWANGTWDGSLVPTTNWSDMVTRNSLTQDHTISVSGGTQKMKAYASFGYLNQDGTQLGQDFTRYSAKFNIEINPVKWFSMGSSIMATYGLQNYGFSSSSPSGAGSLYAAARGMLPYTVPYDSTGKRINLPSGDITILNPIGEDKYNENLRKTLRTLGAFHISFTPIQGLNYRLSFGPDFSNYINGRWMDTMSVNRGGGEKGSTNYAQLNKTTNIAWTLDHLLTYNRTIGADHSFGATFLYSATKMRDESSSMTATKLPWSSQKWNRLNSVSVLDGFSSDLVEKSLLSYMGRLNYAYQGKYFFDVYARWDGASQLAPGNKWDMFPAASVAWRIDKEKFLRQASWINMLKLRLGVGSVGNAAIDAYTTRGGVQTLYYTWGSQVEAGYVSSDPSSADPPTMPNPGLGWERTTQTNLGLEFGLLNGRINGTLDLYTSTTRDLLLPANIPSLTGYTKAYYNVGVTANKGIDLSLSTINIQKRDFTWSSTLNFSANRDRIVELANGKYDNVNNKWFIDERLNVYYDYVKEGIWQDTKEDQEEMAKFNANISSQNSWFKAGSIKVADLNGDYKIDPNNDRRIVGHRQPNWNSGLINEFTYKNWSLNIFIFSRWGYTIETGAETMQGRYAQRLVNYWTPTNPTNDYPAPDYSNAAGDTYRLSMNYQNGSFIKIRNISLAYKLPEGVANSLKMKHGRVYVQVMNPGLIYSGVGWLDPDGSSLNRGVVIGVNAGF